MRVVLADKVEELHLKASKELLAWKVYLLLGLVHIKDQYECISIVQLEGVTRLELLGLLVLNPYFHSITAMLDTSPVVHKMLTIKLKIPSTN